MVRFCGVILFMFSFSCFAKNVFTIEQSSMKFGKTQYALTKQNGIWKVYKNTNEFDRSNDIGEFKIKNIKNVLPLLKELEHFQSALVKVEKLMQESPVNKPAFRHQKFYNLGKYPIYSTDSYYSKVGSVFDKIIDTVELEAIDSLKMSKVESKKCSETLKKEAFCISKAYGTLVK